MFCKVVQITCRLNCCLLPDDQMSGSLILPPSEEIILSFSSFVSFHRKQLGTKNYDKYCHCQCKLMTELQQRKF